MSLRTSKGSNRLESVGLNPRPDATQHKPACLLPRRLNQSVMLGVVWSQRHYAVLGPPVPRGSRACLVKLYQGFHQQVTPGRTKACLHRPAMFKICDLVSVPAQPRTSRVACLRVMNKDDPRPHSRSVAVFLAASSPCLTSVDVHSHNARPVGQACPQLWLLGSFHRGRLLSSADNNPCLMSAGVHCRSVRPEDQPVDLACPQLWLPGSLRSLRRGRLPGSVDSSPCSTTVGVHCRKARLED